MKMDFMMNGRCSEIQNHHKTGSYFSACSFTFKARIPVMSVDHANRGCQPVAERVGLRHDRDQIRWHYPPCGLHQSMPKSRVIYGEQSERRSGTWCGSGRDKNPCGCDRSQQSDPWTRQAVDPSPPRWRCHRGSHYPGG